MAVSSGPWEGKRTKNGTGASVLGTTKGEAGSTTAQSGEEGRSGLLIFVLCFLTRIGFTGHVTKNNFCLRLS